MKSFSFNEDQIARAISAATADELARHFNRHVDFLTAASWTGSTPIGAGGLALSVEQNAACATRAASLFGVDPTLLVLSGAERIEDWAHVLVEETKKSLTRFSFYPAARVDDDPLIHRADEIFQDAGAAANILYGRRRLLSLVAPHSLLGFELSILTPGLLTIESIDARGMTPDSLTKNLAFGDALVATPTLWRYMMKEKLQAPDNTLAVTFGEPMTSELAVEMRNSGFGVMRELYGSTETGLIGWRDSPSEAFVLFDCWRKQDEALIRISPDGTERSVEAMDGLEWNDERSFVLSGRRDGAVQIGAVNVFPDAVASALGDHPLVRNCRIKVGRRRDGASRLIANIILDSAAQPNEKTARAIDAWCRTNLRQQERPQIYNFEREA